jgi:hypothetical protein
LTTYLEDCGGFSTYFISISDTTDKTEGRKDRPPYYPYVRTHH